MCAYLLRHGRSASHGCDGVSMSMLLSEAQTAAGDDTRIHLAGTPKRLVELLIEVSDKPRVRGFCDDPGQPVVLRELQDHSTIQAEPRLIDWRRVDADMARGAFRGQNDVGAAPDLRAGGDSIGEQRQHIREFCGHTAV